MMPHLAEELWHRLGHRDMLVNTPGLVADPKLVDPPNRDHRRTDKWQAAPR